MRSASVRDAFPDRRENGGKQCAYCGKGLPGRKLRYCSEECMNEVFIRCDPGWARARVRDRDGGVCARCKIDTKKVAALRSRLGAWYSRLTFWGQVDQALMVALQGAFDYRGHVWEMNHIVPVSVGGGLCGLANLETLCLRCHKTETRLQRRR